jgi:phage FluMu protein gp41
MAQAPTGRKAREVQTMPDVKKVGPVTGFATLGSGQTSVVASTALVASHSHIGMALQVASFGAIGSNQGGIVVRSVNPGNGIVFGTLTNVAFPWDTTIHWTIADTRG